MRVGRKTGLNDEQVGEETEPGSVRRVRVSRPDERIFGDEVASPEAVFSQFAVLLSKSVILSNFVNLGKRVRLCR